MYRLTFLNGKMKGRRVAVREGVLVLGRDPAATLELPGDPDIALRHATIEERDEACFLCATDAANKLAVNGQPVVEAVLKTGDQIEIGTTQLEFRVIADQEPAGLRRRVGAMQVLAVAAVVIILLAEFFFVVISPILQREPDLSEEAIAAARKRADEKKAQLTGTNTATAAVAKPPAPEITHIRRLIKKAAADTNSAPHEVFVAPVATNILAAPPVPIAPTSAIIPVVTVPPPTPDPVGPTTPEPPAALDPALLAECEKMMADAADKVRRGELAQADQELDRLQILAPEFLPAYAARAKILEARGQLREAAAQWKELEKHAAGTPKADEAKTALARLAKKETSPQPTPPAPETAPAKPKLSNLLQIASVQRERFPASPDHDEMRLFRINLRPKSGAEFNPAEIRVTVAFFDRDLDTGRVFPTRVNVPATTLRPEGKWLPGETKTVTATYSAPRHFRDEELRIHRQRCAFEGYRLQLFHKDELVDEETTPRNLPAN